MVESIYLLMISMGIIGIGFYYLPFFYCLFLLAGVLIVLSFFEIKIATVIFFITTLFLVELKLKIVNTDFYIGKQIETTVKIVDGFGQIEKINGKILKDRVYLKILKISDGEYSIKGKIKKIETVKGRKNLYFTLIDKKREKELKYSISKKIDKLSKKTSYSLGNFMKSVILGRREVLDYEIENSFRVVGISHLLVISGLHISIIIYSLMKGLIYLKINKRVRAIISLLSLSLYILIIGITPSIFRAYIMGVIYLLGIILYEKVDMKKSFSIAYIISLLIYPQWFYSLSFWMSYITVFTIIFVYPKVKVKNKYLNLIIFSLIIQLSLMPIEIIFFDKISYFSFVTNIFLVPFGSLIIVLSFLTLALSFFHLEFLTLYILDGLYIIFIKIIILISGTLVKYMV